MHLKDHIAASAIYLFSRNGIKRVSMDDVARKANVSKRTLYEFFGDKESLLIEVLIKLREPIAEQMELLENSSYTALEIMLLFNEKLMDKPTWMCENFYEDIRRYPDAFNMLLESKLYLLKKITVLFKRGAKESVFLSDINFDIISLMAQQQFTSSEPPEVYKKYTHEEVHNTFFFIFLRGICTDLGRDIIDKYVNKKRYKELHE